MSYVLYLLAHVIMGAAFTILAVLVILLMGKKAGE